MPGNSQRPNRRRAGTKKGQVVGSGGQGKRALQGRGPTPTAGERAGHPSGRGARGAGGRGAPRGAATSGGDRSRSPGTRGSRSGPQARDATELVHGRNPVVEALRAGVPAAALYVASHLEVDDRVREARKLAVDAGVPLLEGPRQELDRITGGSPHQGLVLAVPPYSYVHPDDLVARVVDAGATALIVALDGVTDPHNLGAVVRSTAAFGGHGVLVPQRRAAGITAAAWKASAGAASRVPVARATNLTRALESYRRAGLVVVGLDAAGELDLDDLEAALDPLVLVVGSEGSGLSRLVREACDLVARIPIAAGTESLNVSVAAGIALYEVARRRAG